MEIRALVPVAVLAVWALAGGAGSARSAAWAAVRRCRVVFIGSWLCGVVLVPLPPGWREERVVFGIRASADDDHAGAPLAGAGPARGIPRAARESDPARCGGSCPRESPACGDGAAAVLGWQGAWREGRRRAEHGGTV